MKTINFNYFNLIVIHVLIGVVIYAFRGLSKVYLAIVFLYFVFNIIQSSSSKRTVNVLVACSYIIAGEVFMRMTGGNFLYEISKYTVIAFLILGIFFESINRSSYPYLIYIFLLVPGIVMSSITLNYETVFRKAVAFNLSGPVCLGIAALYCFKRPIKVDGLNDISKAIVLPVIANTVYLFLYNPSIKDVLSGTQSNFEASGGFGPNQVSTILGLGILALVVRYITFSKSTFLKVLNLSLLALVAYRAIITFSRGGVITAIICVVAFLSIYFVNSSIEQKRKLTASISIIVVSALAVWIFTSIQTLGFIDKRYANQDAAGRVKEDFTTGRVELLTSEFEEFFKNPFLGVGVGKIKEARLERIGINAASHNEMSRILAEHGIFGVFAFLILLVTPILLRSKNKKNYLFYSFYFFWFLTINHSSMRIAAPAFIYSLCLLDIQYAKPTLHRKQVKQVQ